MWQMLYLHKCCRALFCYCTGWYRNCAYFFSPSWWILQTLIIPGIGCLAAVSWEEPIPWFLCWRTFLGLFSNLTSKKSGIYEMSFCWIYFHICGFHIAGDINHRKKNHDVGILSFLKSWFFDIHTKRKLKFTNKIAIKDVTSVEISIVNPIQRITGMPKNWT